MITGIRSAQFVSFLDQRQKSQQSLYLHHSDKKFYTLFQDKNAHHHQGKIYKRLTYREIVLLGRRFAHEIKLSQNNLTVVLGELVLMREHKKNSMSKLPALICDLWDRSLNWIEGHQWKSTKSLEAELTKTFQSALAEFKAQSTQPDQHTQPSRAVVPNDEALLPVNPLPVPDFTNLNLSHSSPESYSSRKKPLRTRPHKISAQPKGNLRPRVLFPDDNPIQIIMADPPPEKTETRYRKGTLSNVDKGNLFSSFEGMAADPLRLNANTFERFLQEMTGSKTISSDRACLQILCDVLLHGTIETQNQLCQWLESQTTMNFQILIACLNALHIGHTAKKSSPHAVLQLLKIYRDKQFNVCHTDIHGNIDRSVRMLIEALPKEHQVIEEFVNWIARQPHTSDVVFNHWMRMLQT